jgi:NADH dehydrogenase (ubiquinone) 1 alpha subcomplex subunit 12
MIVLIKSTNVLLLLLYSRMDDMKAGRLVGEDKYGNKYYEDPSQFYSRNRWVEYDKSKNMEYDGSQIPADWYGWMHFKVN